MPMAPSAQTRKSNATRQTILDAALRVIARKGYSAATVDEIVKEAGVSKGLAYYHFKSKADMGKSILAQGISNLTGEFHKIADNASDATSALRSMLEYFTRTMVDNRAFGKFFLSELWRGGRVWSSDIREADQNLVLLLASQIERGQAEEAFRPDIDPEFAAVSFIGTVVTSASYYLDSAGDNTPMNADEFVERVAKLAHNATVIESNPTS